MSTNSQPDCEAFLSLYRQVFVRVAAYRPRFNNLPHRRPLLDDVQAKLTEQSERSKTVSPVLLVEAPLRGVARGAVEADGSAVPPTLGRHTPPSDARVLPHVL